MVKKDLVKTFYTQYDLTIPKVCKPYQRFIEIVAEEIPKTALTVCDIGIGTGNLGKAIQKIIPNVKIIGIDNNPKFLLEAKNKIRGLEVIEADAFSTNLEEYDFYVSSLTLHHLSPRLQKDKLIDILNHSRKGFINFDLILPPNRSRERILESVIVHAKKYFEENQLPQIKREILKKDRPITLKEHRETFEKKGYRFTLLQEDFPFGVYKATKE